MKKVGIVGELGQEKIMEINTKKFAAEWIESWNSHDLNRILSHYSNDVEITTPMIKVVLSIENGTLKGKEKIRSYWEAAFKNVPDLHFELKEVTESVGSIAIYYKSVLGKMAIEVMFFNEEGEVNKVVAHYT